MRGVSYSVAVNCDELPHGKTLMLSSSISKPCAIHRSPLLDVPQTSQSIYSFLLGFESRRLPQSVQKTSAPMAIILLLSFDH